MIKSIIFLILAMLLAPLYSAWILKAKAWFGGRKGSPLLFVAMAFFIVLLTESSRVPVDDPATHLELTMIHEVMVLDHSGPDFALIELGSFFKLFFYSTLVTRLICPFNLGHPLLDAGLFFIVLGLVYTAVGVTESVMARYRMDKVPQFVLTSFALAFFATIITLEFLK